METESTYSWELGDLQLFYDPSVRQLAAEEIKAFCDRLEKDTIKTFFNV
jgi:hypothetical protein